MSDLATMRQLLMRELHVDPDTTDANSQVTNDTTIAIIEAIKYNSKFRLGFNERWWTFDTAANVGRYDIPHWVMGIVPDAVWMVPDNEFLAKTKLKPMPLQQANQVQQSAVASAAYREIGTPYGFAIDAGAKQFVLLPVPSVDGDAIEMQVVADIGTPRMLYTGSAWAFYEPSEDGEPATTSATAIATTFTNEWFQQAFWLTYHRAAYWLFANTYAGTGGADAKANSHITQWTETLNGLRSETRMLRSVTEIRKWI